MAISLQSKDLINVQQMEVAVNGPDGATHLILCTGLASLGPHQHETYTFLAGPRLSRRQFVGAIASGALAALQTYEQGPAGEGNSNPEINLVLIAATYNDESAQVQVSAEVRSSQALHTATISYSVSILAELRGYGIR